MKGTLRAQLELVNDTFTPDIKARIAQLPRLEVRALYSAAQILFVMKTAVLQSPDRNDDRSDAMIGGTMNDVLLMANDLIDADLVDAVERVKDPDELAKMLLPHSVRSTMINAADAHNTTMPRASIMFSQVGKRADVLERAGAVAFDIETRFKALTGLSLEDYFALGWMLIYWFALGVRQPEKYPDNRSLNPATFFSQTRLDPATGASLLARLTHDHVSLGEAIRKRLSAGRLFSYDVVPFMERPLYQIRGDVLVPTSLAFLASRLSTGVYWILFDAMDSKERDGWSAYYGHILEAYVRDTIIRSFPAARRSDRRVLPEAVYRVGKREMRTSDVVLLYPDAAIFFEVTATRVRMEATRLMDDPGAIEDDLEKIVLKKTKQLSDRIDHFQKGHYSLGGSNATQVNKILPVVVTGEPIPLWTTTAKAVRHELSKRGLLQQAGVGPLRIISVDEVEMLEALVAQGVDPLDVLRNHAGDSDLRDVSLRNYMQRHYKVPPNATLQAEYVRVGNNGAQLLFGTHLGPPTQEEIATRAYELFEARDRQHGHDVDDWLRAERELFLGSSRDFD